MPPYSAISLRKLADSAERTGSILSVGYDPAPQQFPIDDISGYDPNLPDPMNVSDREYVKEYITDYFASFLNECEEKNITPSAFKLNLGYFKMYDDLENNSGSVALNNIIKMISSFGDIPVILDVKDADIARSSAAFAISHLKIEEIDAITVNPYLGTDSVEPFFQLASDLNKVVYILTRTTNDGAVDFQERTLANSRSNISENIINNDCELYLAVANKLIEWSRSYEGVVGSVVAGNYTNELRKVARLFVEKNADIPLLIPGIGTQGGDAQSVMQVLDEVGYDHRLARISSSSGVMYRGQKENLPQSRHSEVSAEEVERLNHEIELSSYI